MIIAVVLFVVVNSFAASKLDMFREHVFNHTLEAGYTPVDFTTIPTTKKASLEKLDFDNISCEPKSSSSLYLHMDCRLLKSDKEIDIVKVVVRVKQQLQKQESVEKNSKVNIVYINKNLRITVEGVALEKGNLGQQIRVKVAATGKVLKGVVISGSEVLVQEDQ